MCRVLFVVRFRGRIVGRRGEFYELVVLVVVVYFV